MHRKVLKFGCERVGNTLRGNDGKGVLKVSPNEPRSGPEESLGRVAVRFGPDAPRPLA